MVNAPCNSGFPIYQDEDDGEEDCELLTKLARLIEHEQREIQPHQDSV